MTVSLKPITCENWRTCIQLEPAEEQRHFVAPNVYSLTEAQFYPGVETRAIYADDIMVGFVMWGTSPDLPEGETWVWRLMIDRHHQHKGYGRAAMKLVLDAIRVDPRYRVIKLSFEPDNTGAEALYASLGFEKTGEMVNGELVMRLDCTGTP